MKRGSLVCFGSPPTLLPTFRFACVYQPVFVRIFLKQLQDWNFTPAQRSVDDSFARYSGDLVSLGKGEVLVACAERRQTWTIDDYPVHGAALVNANFSMRREELYGNNGANRILVDTNVLLNV